MFILLLCVSLTFGATKEVKKSEPHKTIVSSKDGIVTINLSKENTLIMNTYFDGSSVAEVMDKARQMDASLPSGDPMFLFIDSGGGSIYAGLELQNYLNSLNRPIHTITSFAASMGFQTVQFLGKRYILPFGELMSHKATGGFYGEFGDGLSQLDQRYVHWLERITMMDKQTVKRTNGKQTLKSYRAAYENELWLNGEKAVAQGYADAVVKVVCNPTLKGSWSRTESFRFMGYKIVFVDTFSDCPTIGYPLSMKTFVTTPDGDTYEYYGHKEEPVKKDTTNYWSSKSVFPTGKDAETLDTFIKEQEKTHRNEVLNKKNNIKKSY